MKAVFSRNIQRCGYLRGIVHRSYKIYVVGAFFLKFKKNFGKTFDGNKFSRFTAAYFSVLAKNTAHCAAGKKDGSGTFFTGNAGFFPKMKSGPCNFNFFSAAAKTVFSGKAVCTASSRAKFASFGKFHFFAAFRFFYVKLYHSKKGEANVLCTKCKIML